MLDPSSKNYEQMEDKLFSQKHNIFWLNFFDILIIYKYNN